MPDLTIVPPPLLFAHGSEWQRADFHLLAATHIRTKVDHTFRAIKSQIDYVKTRYRIS
jgi:hypothetical protein